MSARPLLPPALALLLAACQSGGAPEPAAAPPAPDDARAQLAAWARANTKALQGNLPASARALEPVQRDAAPPLQAELQALRDALSALYQPGATEPPAGPAAEAAAALRALRGDAPDGAALAISAFTLELATRFQAHAAVSAERAWLEDAAAAAPEDPALAWLSAYAGYLDGGSIRAALYDFARCLELDPDHPSCRLLFLGLAKRFREPSCPRIRADAPIALHEVKGGAPEEGVGRADLVTPPVITAAAFEAAEVRFPDPQGRGWARVTVADAARARLAEASTRLTGTGRVAIVVDGKITSVRQVTAPMQDTLPLPLEEVPLHALCAETGPATLPEDLRAVQRRLQTGG